MAFVSDNQSKTQTTKAVSNVDQKVNDAQTASEDIKYTLFASGLNYGGRDVELADKNTTDDIAIIFDAVQEHSYTRTVSKTSYPVESKVTFSDHGVIEDGKFSFSGIVNTSPHRILAVNYIDKDTDQENPAQSQRPEKALEVLERIVENRQLVSLVTEDKILENYIITSMEATRQNDEGAALSFDIEMEEFRTFTLDKTVLATIYSDPKKSGGKTKQKGAVTSSSTEEDIEVYKKETRYMSKAGKNIMKPASDIMGLDTDIDKNVGVLHPDGTFTDSAGTKHSTIPDSIKN